MFSFDREILLKLDYDSYGLSKFDKEVVMDMIQELIPFDVNDNVLKILNVNANRNFILLYIVEHSKTLSVEEANFFLYSCDSFGRPEILHTLHSKVGQIEWLKLFRDFWTMCDSCSLYHKEFKEILKSYNIKTLRRHIHTTEDNAFYNDLPEEFEVYRGTFLDERFKYGISWTTDYEVASKFELGYRNFSIGGPMIYRYKTNMRPEVFSIMEDIGKHGTDILHMYVNKSSVFVLTSRGEKEIIVL